MHDTPANGGAEVEEAVRPVGRLGDDADELVVDLGRAALAGARQRLCELVEELPLQFIPRDARFVGGDTGRRGPRLRRLAEVVGDNLGVAAVGGRGGREGRPRLAELAPVRVVVGPLDHLFHGRLRGARRVGSVALLQWGGRDGGGERQLFPEGQEAVGRVGDGCGALDHLVGRVARRAARPAGDEDRRGDDEDGTSGAVFGAGRVGVAAEGLHPELEH